MQIFSPVRQCAPSRIGLLNFLLFLLFYTVQTHAQTSQAGALDPNFNASVSGGVPVVNAVLVQPDGKILIAGGFNAVNGVARANIARLNFDGSVDPTFAPGAGPTGSSSPDRNVFTLALQRNGKILIGGEFTRIAGRAQSGIARLNADGSFDPTFNVGAGTAGFGGGTPGTVTRIIVQSDEKILIAGGFFSINNVDRVQLARLNPNGDLDLSFNPGPDVSNAFQASILALALQPDGQALHGTNRTIFRRNVNGSIDFMFNAPQVGPSDPSSGGGSVCDLDLQPDGKILVSGDFPLISGVTRNGVARLNPNGDPDLTFNPGSGATGSGLAITTIRALARQPDGKIVIGGDFTQFNGIIRNRIARLNADASLDSSFDPGAGVTGGSQLNNGVFDIALQPDGNILIAGNFTQVNGVARAGVARLIGGAAAPPPPPPPSIINVNNFVGLRASAGALTGSPGPCSAPYTNTLPVTFTLSNITTNVTLSNLALSLVTLQERDPILGVLPRLSSCDNFNCAATSGPTSGLGGQPVGARPQQRVLGTLGPGAATTVSATLTIGAAQRLTLFFDVLGVTSGGAQQSSKLGQLAVTVTRKGNFDAPTVATHFIPTPGVSTKIMANAHLTNLQPFTETRIFE